MNDSPYMNDYSDPEQNGGSSHSPGGWIIMIAFTACLIGIIVTAKMGLAWAAAFLFGVCFLIVSVPLLVQELAKPRKHLAIPLICTLVGIAACFGSVLWQFSSEQTRHYLEEHSLVLFLGLFILIGMGIMIGGIASMQRKKRICTELITATCVALERSQSSRNRTYRPVYEFYYDGRTHRISSGSYTNFGNPQIGESREIYIDPQYPDEYYEPVRAKKTLVLLTIVGGAFVIAAVLILLLGHFVTIG